MPKPPSEHDTPETSDARMIVLHDKVEQASGKNIMPESVGFLNILALRTKAALLFGRKFQLNHLFSLCTKQSHTSSYPFIIFTLCDFHKFFIKGFLM